MTARKDFVSTFDFLHFPCDEEGNYDFNSCCKHCKDYTSCSEFLIQFKYENFINTMSYTEGEV